MKHRFILILSLILTVLFFLFASCKDLGVTDSAYPWEKEGKLPSDYTWEEYNALSESDQEAFFEWFGNSVKFEMWFNDARKDITDQFELYSWETGEKKPPEYSWEEYQALDEFGQEAFYEWFDSPDDFELWMNSVKKDESNLSETYPWENGGKQPSEYTWKEFQEMDELEQEVFFEWFDTSDEFEEWMNKAKKEENGRKEFPWESDEKMPDEYTWEEFQSLNSFEQEAFFEWFESPDDFETWMNSVNR